MHRWLHQQSAVKGMTIQEIINDALKAAKDANELSRPSIRLHLLEHSIRLRAPPFFPLKCRRAQHRM